MPLKFWDGELKTEPLTGWLPTAGTPIGVIAVSLRLREETMNAELKEESLLEFLNFDKNSYKNLNT